MMEHIVAFRRGKKLTTRGCSQYSRAVGLVDGVVVELSPDITGQWWSLKQKKWLSYV